jgi:hypothetical protein
MMQRRVGFGVLYVSNYDTFVLYCEQYSPKTMALSTEKIRTPDTFFTSETGITSQPYRGEIRCYNLCRFAVRLYRIVALRQRNLTPARRVPARA